MKFSLVSSYFEKLSNTSSRLEMAKILKDLFLKCPNEDIANLIYFCKGNLGPAYNKKEINIGQSIIISLVSQYLGVSEDVVKRMYSKYGDLGLVIQNANTTVKQKVLFSKKLEFREVFSILQKISEIKGSNSIEEKKKLFKYILFNSDIISVKYIVRFPLSFRLGFGDSTIIDALIMLDTSVDAKSAKKIVTDKYNLVSDLGMIAEIIKKKGVSEVRKLKIQLFIPVKSALCERAKSFKDILDRLGKCAIDSKIDGFRQQIHKNKDIIKIFSRQEEDITDMFPDVVKEIKKIPHDFIIDCEAIGYDPIHKKYHTFQITMQRKRKYDVEEKSIKLPLHLKVFDVLYLDGNELISKPFIERRKILEDNFNYPPIIKPTELIITDNVEEAERFFNERLNLGLEGIIAKDISSNYVAGSRGFSWIKFKRSYSSKINDTVDACIVGGFYGQGKWSKFGVGAFLMAIYDKTTDKYYTIAKLGSGLTEDILEQLSLEIKKLEKKPDYVITNIEPDFYVIPKIVVEINYDEITNSSLHTACFNKETKQGLALRFPRIVRIRSDKSDKQTTTLEEFRKLYNMQV